MQTKFLPLSQKITSITPSTKPFTNCIMPFNKPIIIQYIVFAFITSQNSVLKLMIQLSTIGKFAINTSLINSCITISTIINLAFAFIRIIRNFFAYNTKVHLYGRFYFKVAKSWASRSHNRNNDIRPLHTNRES